eukprot:gene5784-7195_t
MNECNVNQETSSSSSTIVEVDSSVLGTKNHWDKAYERELNCFNETGDVGEIWFGETCLRTLCKSISKIDSINKIESKIIDLGCGNGMTLIQLAKLGFKNLNGSDYSETAIELAKKIALEENFEFINYFMDDITQSKIKENEYDVVVDKGTFDAMALSEDRDKMKKSYLEHVLYILKQNGYFIITSCNYTKTELLLFFNDSNFNYIQNVEYPVFKFGGSTGSSQTTLIFIKK